MNSYMHFSKINEIGGDLDTFTLKQLEWFKERQINFQESTPDEILKLAQEMNNRITGKYIENQEIKELREKFFELFPKDHPMRTFPSPIAGFFLLQCREEFK